ncbi:hypothetical protein C8R47DRAFT_1214517 [Mycena vitilis]|nr:hypothetical protein C8R47DRAFT_1214517 [Mycena vitilis]
MDLSLISSLSKGAVLINETWSEQLQFLTSCQDARSRRLVLYTMTPRELLSVCMVSPDLHRVVVEFLRYVRRNGQEEEDETLSSSGDSDSDTTMSDAGSIDGPPSVPFAGLVLDIDMSDAVESHAGSQYAGFLDLPPEVALAIVAMLGPVEKARLRATCSGSAALVAEALLHTAAKLLTRFGLDFDSVRLLLTVSGAVISGSASAFFFHPSFAIGDLDFIVGHGKSDIVIDYLLRCAPCVPRETVSAYPNMPGVSRVFTLCLGEELKIDVIESDSANPLNSIVLFHLSCVYGAWLAGGFWHGYPRLTAAGIALTTPPRMHVNENHSRQKLVYSVLLKYVKRGFKICLNELPRDHTCGVDFECPSTIRTTNDRGCAYSPFPAWTYSSNERELRPTYWSLGGRGCQQGVLAQNGVSASCNGTFASKHLPRLLRRALAHQ